MSNVFKFRKRETLVLDFETVKFEIDVKDPSYIKRMEDFSKSLIEMEKEYNQLSGAEYNSDLDVSGKTEDIMNKCVDSIDKLLGSGATKSIFDGQKEIINIFDLRDLSKYIVDNVASYTHKNMLEKYDPQRLEK